MSRDRIELHAQNCCRMPDVWVFFITPFLVIKKSSLQNSGGNSACGD